MDSQIAIPQPDGIVRVIPKEDITHLQVLMDGLGGEEAVALTMAAWNIEGSVDMEEVRDSVANFYTNVFLFRKAVLEMINGK